MDFRLLVFLSVYVFFFVCLNNRYHYGAINRAEHVILNIIPYHHFHHHHFITKCVCEFIVSLDLHCVVF